MKRSYLIVFIIALTASQAWAQSEIISQSDNETNLEKKLEQRISVNLVDKEFGNFVSTLKTKYRFNVLIHQSAKDAGLADDDLVTMQFEDTRLRTVFDIFFGRYDATYCIKDNFVVIMTVDEAQNHLRVKVYPCHDIITTIKPKRKPAIQGGGFGNTGSKVGGPAFNMTDQQAVQAKGKSATPPQEKSAGQDKTTAKTKTTNPATSKSDSPSEKEDLNDPRKFISPTQQLIDLVRGTIDPDSWEETEGLGTINAVGNLLVVCQTEQTHTKIRRLFEQLRKHNKKQVRK